ncbi:MAG: DUF1043 family protein [Azoarcus sp.]|nr:DUF1043 family protein [Azoarcus sp.]
MTGQAMWAFVIVAVVAAALIGFLFGRTNGNGAKQKLKELEADLQGKDRELAVYKREVDAHFDQTASLFVSMAGSYKALFEHLSEGYAKLSDGSDRDLFRERVATLLIDGPRHEAAREDDDWRSTREDVETPAQDADDAARDEAEATQLQADADEDARAAADASPEVDEERVSPAEAHGPTGNGQEPPAVDAEPEQAPAAGAGSAAEAEDSAGQEQGKPAVGDDEDEVRPTSAADAQAVESAHKS